MKPEPEFYIGWQAKAPASIAKTIRWTVVGFFLFALVAGAMLAARQRTIGVSVFEWGNLKTFSGRFYSLPYPHLISADTEDKKMGPGENPITRLESSYLVKPFKFGLDEELLKKFDGLEVTLRGTLIYRDNQTMIEVVPETIEAMQGGQTKLSPPLDSEKPPVSLGKQTILGEIVDSKCFLGVMNPGRYVPHKGCAIRCISGGCPPLFIPQEQKEGETKYYLLVSAEGKAINKEVLDKVAEPLEITGEVVQQGNLYILKADPAGYRRVK